MKSSACDCVVIPWDDLQLMKITKDESNPIKRIIEMFADFQINQRLLKEAENKLEACEKAMADIQFVPSRQTLHFTMF